MRKLIGIVVLMIGLVTGVYAQEKKGIVTFPTVTKAQKKEFKARRKQLDQLVKQYKKAPENEKAAVKDKVEKLVSTGVEDHLSYMKNYVAQQRERLDRWEAKIQADEQNLPQIKAQRVEDLLTGVAKEKHKQAKKRWKAQLKAQKASFK